MKRFVLTLVVSLIFFVCGSFAKASSFKVDRFIVPAATGEPPSTVVNYALLTEKTYFCNETRYRRSAAVERNSDGSWKISVSFKDRHLGYCPAVATGPYVYLEGTGGPPINYGGLEVIMDSRVPIKSDFANVRLTCVQYVGGLGPAIRCPKLKMNPKGFLHIKRLMVSW